MINIGQQILRSPRAFYAWSLARLDNAPVYGIEHLFGPWERRFFRLFHLVTAVLFLGAMIILALTAAGVIK